MSLAAPSGVLALHLGTWEEYPKLLYSGINITTVNLLPNYYPIHALNNPP